MTLTHPDFRLESRPPNKYITDAMWWLWLRLHELEPTSELSGIYANKKGFHNTGQANLDNWPGNYSVRDEPNHTGPWWRGYASAIDWTFPEAHSGNYARISKYSNRLRNSGRDPNDPRLDESMYQFFGQTDNDKEVEGWNEYKEENASSDSTHLWHMHIEIFRSVCGDYWAMWKILTVLMGWSVQQWRDSLSRIGVDSVQCKKGDKNESVRELQIALVDHGIWVGPDSGGDRANPYKYCDADYGNWTTRAVKEFVGDPNDNGENFGPWHSRLLAKRDAGKFGSGGTKGDKGDQGDPGKTPTKVRFEIPAQTVEAVVTAAE